PTNITLSSTSVVENQPSGTTVGTFSSTDPDVANTFTYSLVTGTGSTDNASFAIVGNSLTTAASFNFEAKPTYSIRVRTTDQGGLFFEKAFTITVTNVNETPTNIGLSNSSVAENEPVGATVGALSTTDPDAANTFTYALVTGTGSTDNANFTIFGNSLRTAVSFDFETKSSYSIRIRSTDQGGLFVEDVFTITVTDVNEAPTNITLSSTSVAENQPSGTTVGTLSTTDPDAGNTFTYSLVAGTGSADNASFTITGNTLKTAVSFNFETRSSYSIRVRSTDQGALFFEKVLTITVTNVNEAPTNISLSSVLIAENAASGTTVGTFSTTDPDAANTFTYSLVAGTGSTNNASFTIVGNSLRTAASFNFETTPTLSIRVRSTDQGGLSFEKVFTITVTNVNETPVAISLDNNTVSENLPIGTLVGSCSTQDPDVGNTFTYSLVAGTGGDDNASFSIAGNSLRTNAVFDFSVKSTYTIRVRSTDQGGLSVQQVFTILITNVNQPPTNISLSASSIIENLASGTTVGTLSTTDPDPSSLFTYTLVGGVGSTDNASFAITGNSLKTAAIFDFETKSSYSIRIRSTDQGGLFIEKIFTITVTNVNESPSNILLSNNTVVENLPAATPVGVLNSVDPEPGNTFTYSLVAGTGSTHNSSFTIVGNSLRTAASLNFESGSTRSIRIRSTDQSGASFEKVFSIAVINMPEGTPSDDAFTMTYSNTDVVITVSTNGQAPVNLGTFPLSIPLTLYGLAGTDSVNIVGTVEGDVIDVSNTRILVNGSTLILNSIESLQLTGRAGDDTYRLDADAALGLITLDESGGGIDTFDFTPTSTS
ncbi:MAG: cadherin repeat domain-containing protein, partial [Planctomycetes bacterium]|nr:cadherin repeat domain-containing protein [Planctomycetota bacterium]